MLTNKIGISLKLISVTAGSWGKSFGKSERALSTASFIFCFASATFTSVLNSTNTLVKSCVDVLFTFLTPDTPLICFSIGLATRFSISEGEVPG